MEENSLSCYVKQSVEPMLKEVKPYRNVITDNAIDPKTLKKEIYKDKENVREISTRSKPSERQQSIY